MFFGSAFSLHSLFDFEMLSVLRGAVRPSVHVVAVPIRTFAKKTPSSKGKTATFAFTVSFTTNVFF
jgi:hypothetical protein